VVRQLFISEPLNNTIAVVDLGVTGTAPNQVFSATSVARISAVALNFPVDLTPVIRDTDSPNWASNTALDDGSDFYVVNQGDGTILRMMQDGTVVAARQVMIDGHPMHEVILNGITTSVDASTIFATFVVPSSSQGGVLEMSAF
jgi:hypothetical protein